MGILKVVLFEFCRSGGMADVAVEQIPPNLLLEGSQMLRALGEDMRKVPETRVLTVLDGRIDDDLSGKRGTLVTLPGASWMEEWVRLASDADLAVVIAPENHHRLESCLEHLRQNGIPVLAPEISFVATTSDKYATYQAWHAHQITTPPTCLANDPELRSWLASLPQNLTLPWQGWILKPRDGVGCEGLQMIGEAARVMLICQSLPHPEQWIVQPFLTGTPGSISCLAGKNLAVLPAMTQHIEHLLGFSEYSGGHGPWLAAQADQATQLIRSWIDAIPGQPQGWIGIDVVLTPDGNLVPIEINPRLTTSYLGLRALVRNNLAEGLIAAHRQRSWRPRPSSLEVRFAPDGRTWVRQRPKSRKPSSRLPASDAPLTPSATPLEQAVLQDIEHLTDGPVGEAFPSSPIDNADSRDILTTHALPSCIEEAIIAVEPLSIAEADQVVSEKTAQAAIEETDAMAVALSDRDATAPVASVAIVSESTSRWFTDRSRSSQSRKSIPQVSEDHSTGRKTMKKGHRFSAKKFRVADDERIKLHKIPTIPEDGFDDKDAAQEAVAHDVSSLQEMQQRLFASGSHSLLIILQGMDAAGKDGVIRHVMNGVNPQGCRAYSFRAPNADELQHHFLWRPMRYLPDRGMISIFNRSYYEEVIVVRVHPEFLEPQRLPKFKKISDLWDQRFEEIRNFEEMLHRHGTHVLKFYLHVSLAEQKRRLLERLKDPTKQWKFNARDLEERSLWESYQDAYNAMLPATSTKRSPWYVVPADNKWYCRAVIADLISQYADGLGLEFPEVTEAKKAQYAQLASTLEQEGPPF